MQHIFRNIVFTLLVGVILPVSNRGTAQVKPSSKPILPVQRAAGPNAVSQDFGDVAVLVDNGLIVTDRNLFDLNGTTIRFTPAGADQYTVSHSAGTLDTVVGPALPFGFSAATEFPGDDDTQQIAFPAGFPFFGTTYTSVWVNTDGNVTFGAPDYSSDDRDKARHISGPPRVTAFLADWSPQNALNPTGHGSVHAVLKTGPDRLVVTWSGVSEFNTGGLGTFQLILYSTGVAEVVTGSIPPPVASGVVGIAQGNGAGPIQQLDLGGSPSTVQGGAILEAFAPFTTLSRFQIGREFYKTHSDMFDFLTVMTDFTTDRHIAYTISSQTHGIGARINPSNGGYERGSVFDFSAPYGSTGEIEKMFFMNNIFLYPSNSERLVNPPIEPYRDSTNYFQLPWYLGLPVTLDGQPMSQVRSMGTMAPDDGEFSRYFAHGGSYSVGLHSAVTLLSQLVELRWGVFVRFVHPTEGEGFGSYDLLGSQAVLWSYFVNTAVPDTQFPDAPRASSRGGNHIIDLGPLTSYNGVPTNLAPGEHVFMTPTTQLMDGFSVLDQYLAGMRRAEEVGPFWYVDEPKSIYTGQSLDPFNPSDVFDPLVTMRGWQTMGGIVFKGKRVDLSVQNIMDFEKFREGNENPKGKRFWGPKGNLKVRYFSDSRRVDPNGDASVTLSEVDRELGDEADMIDANGKPVDVKTMAFILVVKSGDPSAHASAISQVDAFRQAWHAYGNGPATGGRGKFDTRLNPPIH